MTNDATVYPLDAGGLPLRAELRVFGTEGGCLLALTVNIYGPTELTDLDAWWRRESDRLSALIGIQTAWQVGNAHAPVPVGRRSSNKRCAWCGKRRAKCIVDTDARQLSCAAPVQVELPVCAECGHNLAPRARSCRPIDPAWWSKPFAFAKPESN